MVSRTEPRHVPMKDINASNNARPPGSKDGPNQLVAEDNFGRKNFQTGSHLQSISYQFIIYHGCEGIMYE